MCKSCTHLVTGLRRVCGQPKASTMKLQKEKEYVQRMEDRLYKLGLENTSLTATVKNQNEEIELLKRNLQDIHQGLEPRPSLAPTAARENEDISKKHTSVITEMKNTIKILQAEVSSMKSSMESSQRELEKCKKYFLKERRNRNRLYELKWLNDWLEEFLTKYHIISKQNNSVSNSLNTRLINKCSCVEKPHQLEMEDGQNLVESSSSSGSTHAYMACSPWMSGNDMRELSGELSDLKNPMQLSLGKKKNQKSDIGKLPGRIIGKPVKKITLAHKIEECDICRDYAACMSTSDSLSQCSELTNNSISIDK